MKKSNRTILRNIIIIGLIIGAVLYGINQAFSWAFFDIQRIKGEEFITTSTSPSQKYTATAYLNTGYASVGVAVLVSIKNNKTGTRKNIYWQYNCENADISWLDDKNIIINNKTLNVEKDTYDDKIRMW